MFSALCYVGHVCVCVYVCVLRGDSQKKAKIQSLFCSLPVKQQQKAEHAKAR